MTNKQCIPTEEITLHSLSHADPQGRLFTWNNIIYRGIPEAGVKFQNRLFDDGVVQDLVTKGLVVPTERTTLVADGFPLVLKHATVDFVSYPFEWNGEMLRDAALHTLRLLKELAARGLTLKDAHGWNILFEGTRPIFVDFGSIIESASDAWRVEKEFSEQFLYPLEFLSASQSRIARRLMEDFERGISVDEYALIGGFSPVQVLRQWVKVGKASAKRNLPAGLLGMLMERYRSLKRKPAVQAYKAFRFDGLAEQLAAIKLPTDTTNWSGYYDAEFPSLNSEANWTPKHHAIHRLLQQYSPASVLDIGANRGWYSMLAAKAGARVVAFDTDEVCLNQLHLDAKKAGLDVQPLMMNFCQPSPRRGVGDGIMHSAHERFQCDLVLGLALVHHMVFKSWLSFEQIAAGFAAYTREVLVVEFVPADDQHVSKWKPEQYPWYRVENFITALRRHFSKVTPMASFPSPRVLLVCER